MLKIGNLKGIILLVKAMHAYFFTASLQRIDPKSKIMAQDLLKDCQPCIQSMKNDKTSTYKKHCF
jgi:hypothetical protein